MSGHHERDIKFMKKALSKEQSSLAEGFFVSCVRCPRQRTQIFSKRSEENMSEPLGVSPEVTDTNIFRLKGEKYECHSGKMSEPLGISVRAKLLNGYWLRTINVRDNGHEYMKNEWCLNELRIIESKLSK